MRFLIYRQPVSLFPEKNQSLPLPIDQLQFHDPLRTHLHLDHHFLPLSFSFPSSIHVYTLYYTYAPAVHPPPPFFFYLTLQGGSEICPLTHSSLQPGRFPPSLVLSDDSETAGWGPSLTPPTPKERAINPLPVINIQQVIQKQMPNMELVFCPLFVSYSLQTKPKALLQNTL